MSISCTLLSAYVPRWQHILMDIMTEMRQGSVQVHQNERYATTFSACTSHVIKVPRSPNVGTLVEEQPLQPDLGESAGELRQL